ncbi:uncharacterized protein LOC121867488 isoform X2 [Homarus americanus]|nr:uncharacterized protein LOC121867488 isoform X2 [Homarus americanus]
MCDGALPGDDTQECLAMKLGNEASSNTSIFSTEPKVNSKDTDRLLHYQVVLEEETADTILMKDWLIIESSSSEDDEPVNDGPVLQESFPKTAAPSRTPSTGLVQVSPTSATNEAIKTEKSNFPAQSNALELSVNSSSLSAFDETENIRIPASSVASPVTTKSNDTECNDLEAETDDSSSCPIVASKETNDNVSGAVVKAQEVDVTLKPDTIVSKPRNTVPNKMLSPTESVIDISTTDEDVIIVSDDEDNDVIFVESQTDNRVRVVDEMKSRFPAYKRLYLRNLPPPDVLPDDLVSELLSACGTSLLWQRSQDDKRSGYGVCYMETTEAAVQVVHVLHDSIINKHRIQVLPDSHTCPSHSSDCADVPISSNLHDSSSGYDMSLNSVSIKTVTDICKSRNIDFTPPVYLSQPSETTSMCEEHHTQQQSHGSADITCLTSAKEDLSQERETSQNMVREISHHSNKTETRKSSMENINPMELAVHQSPTENLSVQRTPSTIGQKSQHTTPVIEETLSATSLEQHSPLKFVLIKNSEGKFSMKEAKEITNAGRRIEGTISSKQQTADDTSTVQEIPTLKMKKQQSQDGKFTIKSKKKEKVEKMHSKKYAAKHIPSVKVKIKPSQHKKLTQIVPLCRQKFSFKHTQHCIPTTKAAPADSTASEVAFQESPSVKTAIQESHVDNSTPPPKTNAGVTQLLPQTKTPQPIDIPVTQTSSVLVPLSHALLTKDSRSHVLPSKGSTNNTTPVKAPATNELQFKASGVNKSPINFLDNHLDQTHVQNISQSMVPVHSTSSITVSKVPRHQELSTDHQQDVPFTETRIQENITTEDMDDDNECDAPSNRKQVIFVENKSRHRQKDIFEDSSESYPPSFTANIDIVNTETTNKDTSKQQKVTELVLSKPSTSLEVTSFRVVGNTVMTSGLDESVAKTVPENLGSCCESRNKQLELQENTSVVKRSRVNSGGDYASVLVYPSPDSTVSDGVISGGGKHMRLWTPSPSKHIYSESVKVEGQSGQIKDGDECDKKPFVIEVMEFLVRKVIHVLGNLGSIVEGLFIKLTIDITNGKDPLAVFLDTDNIILLELVIQTFSSEIQKNVFPPEIMLLVQKAHEMTKQLLKLVCEKKQNKYLGLDIDTVARASVGKSAEDTLTFIRQMLKYEGHMEIKDTDIKNIFMAVTAKHCELALKCMASNSSEHNHLGELSGDGVLSSELHPPKNLKLICTPEKTQKETCKETSNPVDNSTPRETLGGETNAALATLLSMLPCAKKDDEPRKAVDLSQPLSLKKGRDPNLNQSNNRDIDASTHTGQKRFSSIPGQYGGIPELRRNNPAIEETRQNRYNLSDDLDHFQNPPTVEHTRMPLSASNSDNWSFGKFIQTNAEFTRDILSSTSTEKRVQRSPLHKQVLERNRNSEKVSSNIDDFLSHMRKCTEKDQNWKMWPPAERSFILPVPHETMVRGKQISVKERDHRYQKMAVNHGDSEPGTSGVFQSVSTRVAEQTGEGGVKKNANRSWSTPNNIVHSNHSFLDHACSSRCKHSEYYDNHEQPENLLCHKNNLNSTHISHRQNLKNGKNLPMDRYLHQDHNINNESNSTSEKLPTCKSGASVFSKAQQPIAGGSRGCDLQDLELEDLAALMLNFDALSAKEKHMLMKLLDDLKRRSPETHSILCKMIIK